MYEVLSEILGIEIRVKEYKNYNGIPRYLVNGRKIYKAALAEFEFFIIEAYNFPVDSRMLFNEMSSYQRILNGYVAFSMNEISRQQRDAYIRHGIPFIVLPYQVYLPFIGILFSDKFPIIKSINVKRMNPITQLVFLGLIYSKRMKFAKLEIAKRLNLNPTYVTRATEQLEAMQLIRQEKTGRNVYVERTSDGLDFLRKAEPYLINPVKKYIYTDISMCAGRFPQTGISALSAFGMINPPVIPEFACPNIPTLLSGIRIIDEPGWENPDMICKLEIWNYEPLTFSRNGFVDVVSLFCTLKDSMDERIQGDVDRLLEEYQWL